MSPVVYLVVPCYNEEEVIPHSAAKLLCVLGSMDVDPKSRVLFVDDGSRDRTWEKITDIHNSDFRAEGLKLSHNAGQQNAIWAGLMAAREVADAVITIDCDLQDDPDVMPEFIKAFREGCDVVYGVRSSRDTDTPFKRRSAHLYYSVMRALGVELVYDHSEYRLLSRRALEALSEYGEVNLFLRAMVPTLGFQTAKVYYQRRERVAGESKYPLRKMVALAAQGITSFSDKPLTWVLMAGALITLGGLTALFAAAVSALLGAPAPGWGWVLICLWLLGGLQLLASGLIGEYVGKNYMETKRRPKYIVEKRLKREEA